MKLSKVVVFGNVPIGTRLWLNPQQASARAHMISEVTPMKGEKAPGKDHTLYAANASIGFKAGEEIAIEGDLDRHTEIMLGLDQPGSPTPPAASGDSEKAATAAKAAALDKATADLAAADDAFTAAQAAFDAAPETGKADAQQKLTAAQKARDDAAAALAKAGG